jgi:hypothetical protein
LNQILPLQDSEKRTAARRTAEPLPRRNAGARAAPTAGDQDMKTMTLLGLAVGLAALAACAKNEDNTLNADLNATDNLALPADNMATNVDMNATTNDTNMANHMNMTNHTSDNTVNAY